MTYLQRLHWGLALLALLIAPASVLAEGESLSRLEAMETRLMALEDKLSASEATIDAQRELLQARGALNTHSEGGAMAQVAQNLWISGVVQFGYAYNFNDPDQNIRGIGFGAMADDNSFNFDEMRLLAEWGVENPGDAGAVIELVMGEVADFNSGNDTISDFFDDDREFSAGLADDGILAAQAYVQWMCECGYFKLGKLRAPVGTQSPFTSENVHIMHTLSFGLMDPSFLTGLHYERSLTEQLTIAAMVHNGNDFINDISDGKGVLAWMTYVSAATMASGDPRYTFNASYNVTADQVRTRARTGQDVGDTNDRRHHVNVNLLANLTDDMYAQVEGGYAYENYSRDGGAAIDAPKDGQQYSLWASLVKIINERTYVAGRAEYFYDDGNINACHAQQNPKSADWCDTFFATGDNVNTGNDAGSTVGQIQSDDLEVWTFALTAGWWFNESLLFRAEGGHMYFDYNGVGAAKTVGFEKYGERVDDQFTYMKAAATFYFGGGTAPPGRPMARRTAQ